MSKTSGRNWVGWAVLVLFLILCALDFFQDVGMRDAFSWMDPSQYYSFALSIVEGGGKGGESFEVASLFPYLVAPFLAISASVPLSLLVNLAAALLLAFSILLLRRSLGLGGPVALPVLLVFASPLLIGLSRELYVEYTLAAFVTLQFAVWFRTRDFRDRRWTPLFSLLLASGCLVKMTFPLFLAGPFCFEMIVAVREGDGRRAGRTALAFLLPLALVVAGIRVLWADSFSYYLSLGNTRIPIMRLIGPYELFSVGSFAYYPSQLIRTLLGFLAPFLIVPLLLIRRVGGKESGRLRHRHVVLWLWLVVPLLLLTFQPVKEPRHIAPVVVPAILLMAAGFEAIRSERGAGLVAAAAIVVAMTQYLGITRGLFYAPYRLASPLALEELEGRMIADDPERGRFVAPDGAFAILPWRFSKSIAISGFGPNEALAVAWRFSPGVVIDLDRLGEEGVDPIAYRRFEDLVTYTSFTIYNERVLWRHPYFTLTAEQAVDHADYLLLRGYSEEEAAAAFPGRPGLGRVRCGGRKGEIRLLGSGEGSHLSFREAYAREFLRRGAPPDARERNTIYFSLFLEAELTGDFGDLQELMAYFPTGFKPGAERRHVFWIAHYAPLLAAAHQPYQRHVTGIW